MEKKTSLWQKAKILFNIAVGIGVFFWLLWVATHEETSQKVYRESFNACQDNLKMCEDNATEEDLAIEEYGRAMLLCQRKEKRCKMQAKKNLQKMNKEK